MKGICVRSNEQVENTKTPHTQGDRGKIGHGFEGVGDREKSGMVLGIMKNPRRI